MRPNSTSTARRPPATYMPYLILLFGARSHRGTSVLGGPYWIAGAGRACTATGRGATGWSATVTWISFQEGKTERWPASDALATATHFWPSQKYLPSGDIIGGCAGGLGS